MLTLFLLAVWLAAALGFGAAANRAVSSRGS
jgi:hypothetical protein